MSMCVELVYTGSKILPRIDVRSVSSLVITPTSAQESESMRTDRLDPNS